MDYKKLPKLYFPEAGGEAFSDAVSERREWMRFTDLLFILLIQQSAESPDEAADRIGALLPDSELVRSMEPELSNMPHAAGEQWQEVRDIFIGLVKRTVSEKNPLPLARIIASDMLEPIEILAFLLAYSTVVNRKYEKLSATVSESRSETMRPTIGLCADLARFFMKEDERDISLLFDTDSFLNRVLLEKNESILIGELARPLILRDEAVLFLSDESGSMGELFGIAEYLSPVTSAHNLHEEVCGGLEALYKAAVASDKDAMIVLCGEAGSGRRYVLRTLANALKCRVLSVNVTALFSKGDTERQRLMQRLCTKSVLSDSILYLTDIPENKDDGGLILLFEYIRSFAAVFFVGAEAPVGEEMITGLGAMVYSVKMPDIGTAGQKILWKDASDEAGAGFSSDIDLDELVSKYTMNPGRIYRAIAAASAVSEDSVITKKALEESVRSVCSARFGENATRIISPFTWDDLVVDEESNRLLRLACDRVRYRSRVNDEYGFGAKLPYGRGVAIVLYGPPGTGKTMAAQVLANELGLDIYRIDLSQVSSKYIGETEKNLGVLFDAAKNSNAILFFDEADSLFSKRTAVSSSNDKHANAETSFLLQKIEEYTGVSILATNNLQNFDAAFKRRMTYLIPIGLPDADTREKMWENVFPDAAPLSADIDFKVLAGAVELSGSSIKNAAVSAAYRAAAENRKITMNDIADAVELECVKLGKLGVKNEIMTAMISG